MHKIRGHYFGQNRVTAVFEDGALSFTLAKGATLEQLSDRLASLGRVYSGSPLAITVKFAASLRKAGFQLSRNLQARAVNPRKDVTSSSQKSRTQQRF